MYYESAQDFGVLAPRGWYRFGTYGLDANNLFVSPAPINSSALFSASPGSFTGAASTQRPEKTAFCPQRFSSGSSSAPQTTRYVQSAIVLQETPGLDMAKEVGSTLS